MVWVDGSDMFGLPWNAPDVLLTVNIYQTDSKRTISRKYPAGSRRIRQDPAGSSRIRKVLDVLSCFPQPWNARQQWQRQIRGPSRMSMSCRPRCTSPRNTNDKQMVTNGDNQGPLQNVFQTQVLVFWLHKGSCNWDKQPISCSLTSEAGARIVTCDLSAVQQPIVQCHKRHKHLQQWTTCWKKTWKNTKNQRLKRLATQHF